VKKRLVEFCVKHNVIVPNQSGFRTGHSCKALLLKMTDKWLCGIEEGKTIIAVFLDFRRAFEIIDREILLVKLKKIGVDAVVLRWFESYLTNRYQAVKFGNCISSKKEIKYGVPQGTVLGPILFLLYLN